MMNQSTFGAIVRVNFEQGFINALRARFPNARLVGCLFHWKQAIRRKLIAMGFPKEVVYYMMQSGKLDLLTVLPRPDVASLDSIGTIFACVIIESADFE